MFCYVLNNALSVLLSPLQKVCKLFTVLKIYTLGFAFEIVFFKEYASMSVFRFCEFKPINYEAINSTH